MIMVLLNATNIFSNAVLLIVQVRDFALELCDFLQEVIHREIDITVLFLVVINLEEGSGRDHVPGWTKLSVKRDG